MTSWCVLMRLVSGVSFQEQICKAFEDWQNVLRCSVDLGLTHRHVLPLASKTPNLFFKAWAYRHNMAQWRRKRSNISKKIARGQNSSGSDPEKKVNGCSDEVCMFSNFCLLACLLQSWSHGLRTLHSRNSERILFATGPHWASRKIGAVSDGAEISMAPMHCTNEALCTRVTNASQTLLGVLIIWKVFEIG